MDINEATMKMIVKNIRSMDISGNKLKNLPRIIANSGNNSKLWISGNPCECNCDMLWMKDWLMNTEIVLDKEKVTCSTGKIKGRSF